MPSERIQRQIDRLFDLIEAGFEQRDWERVRELAEDVLTLDPDNGDAQAFIEAAERSLSRSTERIAKETSTPGPASISPPFAVDPPAFFADGRYEVKKFLGEGGKKKVYLAQDTLLDREIAFALIKTEGLDETSRTRVAREAQAMGRLGAHPHIVTVFDLGQHEGQPYMVTELMGGGDVEGLIEEAPDHRIPLDQAIDIAGSVCRGLEFAHSKEIVHRDLKPGNVWLTADGAAKIGDFGLAISLDRSRLTQEGMMVGTVSYMPPEQALGGDVTPRADLYSLLTLLLVAPMLPAGTQFSKNPRGLGFFSLSALIVAFAYSMLFPAIRLGKLSVVIPFVHTSPLFVILLAWLFLRAKEKINHRLLMGALLIGFGATAITGFGE